MALFDRGESNRDGEYITSSSDAATRALSATPVENDFVGAVYDKLAVVYDWTLGPALHKARLQAIGRMGVRPTDRILEVGVGTGINLALYPRECAVTAVDFSTSMLEKAQERVAKHELSNVRLLEMDAGELSFADNSFDIVYAPYLINVVAKPMKVAAEMRRVCRPGGRMIFLNHFRSANVVHAAFDRLVSPLTILIGFKSDFDLAAFLAQAKLQPSSVERLGLARLWSLVICVKD
jgi:phosphatidylethanolamine/phosphatidyl-N-methylethanolamine N-methyltransferase